MNKKTKIINSLIMIFGNFLLQDLAWSTPEDVTETHLKEPTKLYKPLPEYTPPIKLKAHPFVGLGLNTGLSSYKEKENENSVQILGQLQLGYLKNIDSWNLISGELDLLFGQISGEKIEWNIPFGAMIRIGYGYAFGEGFYGVFKGGFGLLKSHYKKLKSLLSTEREQIKTIGTIIAFSYGIEALVSENFMPNAHIIYTHSETNNQLSANSFGLELGAKFLF